jgi:hypothetical protein
MVCARVFEGLGGGRIVGFFAGATAAGRGSPAMRRGKERI